MLRELALCFTFVKSCVKLTVLIMLVWLLYDQIVIINPDKKLLDRIQALQLIGENVSSEEYAKDSELKYILIWSKRDEHLSKLREGQAEFISNDCAYKNCHITKYKNLLGDDYRDFDAIMLNGKDKHLPTKRSHTQTYIFATKESAAKHQICTDKFENYFNFTFTYKLNSDVVWPYFSIYNNPGEVVGPKRNMKWIKKMISVDDDTSKKLENKQYAAVYIMCTCNIDFKKISVISNLQQELRKFYIDIKILKTTRHQCARENLFRMVELDQYYFYLIFEEPDDDFMTAEVLKAFNNYVVPVLFGKSNYMNFLPPHSHINAVKYKLSETALMMAYLIANSTAYSEFFTWRNHYTYRQDSKAICQLCERLNKGVQSSKENFKSWWNTKNHDCNRTS